MSLYPVKLRQLLTEMERRGALAAMAREADASPVNAPADNCRRIALTSDEVHAAIRPIVRFGRFRVRIAIPQGITMLHVPDETMVEIYDEKGEPVVMPQGIRTMAGHLGCAIEAELYHELLKAMGCDIPNN